MILHFLKSQNSPEISRTNTWGGGNKDSVSSYGRSYTSSTLPGRVTRTTYETSVRPDDDRRRSADDLLDDNGRENHNRQGGGKVPLVTKEELVRIYSPGSAELDTLDKPKDPQHEIKRSLKDDLNLQHEQGEGGFVRESIKLNEGLIKRQSMRNDEPPEVTTTTMIIDNERAPQVYRQTQVPEVTTHVMHINSAGRQKPESREERGTFSPHYNDYLADGEVHQPYESHMRHYTVPSITTQKIVYDESGMPISPLAKGELLSKTLYLHLLILKLLVPR